MRVLAVLLAGLCYSTNGFASDEVAPDTALISKIESYCKKIAPQALKFVEYVDGYVDENCSSRALDYCLEPFGAGYNYVEFEKISDDNSIVRASLPDGKYLLEVVDAPSEECASFDSATLFSAGFRLKALKAKDKCVRMKRIPSFVSKYSIADGYWDDKVGGFKTFFTTEQVKNIATGKIVGESKVARVEAEGLWEVRCGEVLRGRTLQSIVIPPRVFAPDQQINN